MTMYRSPRVGRRVRVIHPQLPVEPSERRDRVSVAGWTVGAVFVALGLFLISFGIASNDALVRVVWSWLIK